MYRSAYQRGIITVFYSVGSKPLEYWETHTKNGYISRFMDHDIKSMVLEIGGCNVSTTYMVCPKGKMVLGISMPFLVMVVKNLHKYFSFEVTILDETETRRRFRVSNFQSTTQVLPLCTVMPIGLSEGWNQIQFNLAEFTRRAYKKQFIEVQKIKINANIRLRRIYFTERIIPEDELPAEYKLFFPLAQKAKAKDKKQIEATTDKENSKPANGMEKKSSKPVIASKTSLHLIKSPGSSQYQDYPSRMSKVLKVQEDDLNRVEAVTVVTSGKADKADGAEILEGAVTTGIETTGFETKVIETTGIETTGVPTVGAEILEGAVTTGFETKVVETTGIETTGVPTVGAEILEGAEIADVDKAAEGAEIAVVDEVAEDFVAPEGSVVIKPADEFDAGFEADDEVEDPPTELVKDIN